MKYADTHEFLSHSQSATPASRNTIRIAEKLTSVLKSLLGPHFDPTRLNATERREMGFKDCELDWYTAKYGPLIK